MNTHRGPQQVVSLLKTMQRPMLPREIATVRDWPLRQTRERLSRMFEQGRLRRTQGREDWLYVLALDGEETQPADAMEAEARELPNRAPARDQHASSGSRALPPLMLTSWIAPDATWETGPQGPRAATQGGYHHADHSR